MEIILIVLPLLKTCIANFFLKSWITVGERSKTDSLSLTWQLSNHFSGRLSEHDFVEASADCNSTKATSIVITGTNSYIVYFVGLQVIKGLVIAKVEDR